MKLFAMNYPQQTCLSLKIYRHSFSKSFVLPIQPLVWYSIVDRIIPGKRANYNKKDEHDALMLAVTAYCLAANDAKTRKKKTTQLLLPQGLDIGRLVK